MDWTRHQEAHRRLQGRWLDVLFHRCWRRCREGGTTISITNTVVWEQTAEGTKEMFENENAAQGRFYDKMASACAAAPGMTAGERKKMRK